MSEITQLDNSTDNSSAALGLIAQARKSIDIFSHNLDPRVLDTAEIVSAITAFIKISPNSRLRILVGDPTIAVKQGHRFIELSRKLSSFIAIRKTHEDYQETPFEFLIVDGKALLYRPHAEEYKAILNLDARAECNQQLEFFNTVWEISEPASELRQLFI